MRSTGPPKSSRSAFTTGTRQPRSVVLLQDRHPLEADDLPQPAHAPHQVMKLRVSAVQYSVVMSPSSPIEAAHMGQKRGRSR